MLRETEPRRCSSVSPCSGVRTGTTRAAGPPTPSSSPEPGSAWPRLERGGLQAVEHELRRHHEHEQHEPNVAHHAHGRGQPARHGTSGTRLCLGHRFPRPGGARGPWSRSIWAACAPIGGSDDAAPPVFPTIRGEGRAAPQARTGSRLGRTGCALPLGDGSSYASSSSPRSRKTWSTRARPISS